MDYTEIPSAASNMDLVLLFTCVLLAGWGLYNYLKTIALIDLKRDVRKHARDAQDSLSRANATIVEMLSTGVSIQKQYLKLSELNIHYDDIKVQNKYLQQIAPTSIGKEGLLADTTDEDVVMHMTVISTGATAKLDNNVTLVYRKANERIDFYDKNHWCVISANKVDHPDVFVWLEPYLSAE